MRANSITVVIPARNDGEFLNTLLAAINNQTVLPHEIVIIDSSTNTGVKVYVEECIETVPIIYQTEKKAYPGRARNIGIDLANKEWIAFLDCKTVPEKDWLERYQHLIQAYNADVVIGVTQFQAKTPFQKILQAATYGKIGHHTVPGTLISKQAFHDSGGFLEHVRMGEDIEWRERLIKNGLNIHWPEEPIVTYTGLPGNFLITVKKYFTSAYHTARLNILRNMKDLYLSLLLILSAIVLPKWNYIIGGWDKNILFIPHVTKIYLLSLISFLLIYLLVRLLFFRKRIETLFIRSLKLMIFLFLSLAVYRWNAVIAGWVEDAVFYIPHITKMYLGILLGASIIYRGIVLPLRRDINPRFLFPFKWIKIGLLGLSIDLIKSPGYLYGAVIFGLRNYFVKNNE